MLLAVTASCALAPELGAQVAPPKSDSGRRDSAAVSADSLAARLARAEAAIALLQQQLAKGQDNVVIGSWNISYNRDKAAFTFDKCEMGGYCEERPSVISLAGAVLDAGGPLLGDA